MSEAGSCEILLCPAHVCPDTEVGDGNHSLATAKQCWENLKRKLGVVGKAAVLCCKIQTQMSSVFVS